MPKNSTGGAIFGELLTIDAEGRDFANNFLTEGQNNFGNKIQFFHHR